MEWTPPDGIDCAKMWVFQPSKEAFVNDVSIIGLDLAKNVF
ncbi:IS110 family transposase, partial [Bradyrhizobium sp. AC87j1]